MLGELLLALLVIISCMTLTLPQLPAKKAIWESEKYQSGLLALQTLALSENNQEEIDGIKFNQWGHINGGRTLNFKDKKLVIFLGMGRNEIRQRDAAD